MVEVFITNVQEPQDSHKITQELLEHFPTYKINFDLEDRDKILRIEGDNISIDTIISLLRKNDFQCEVLF
ncbi:MAG: hypothetical protein K9H61_10335 [Bacteroidia bacterium]|nr:hypothetical protein [Bacteroidia bacterium]MCF8427682.1 hypothetical protein [Bacteroidia bacterium]MCF8447380.1 hypothetical protein [Bacteroidia bacterium]